MLQVRCFVTLMPATLVMAYARIIEMVWLQALIDLPIEHSEVAGDFWTKVSASRRGDVHPDHPEFVSWPSLVCTWFTTSRPASGSLSTGLSGAR